MSDYTQEALLVLELTRVRAENAALTAHVEWLHGEIELRHFGLGFTLRYKDFDTCRESIKREQEKLGALLEAKPETSLAKLKALDAAEFIRWRQRRGI